MLALAGFAVLLGYVLYGFLQAFELIGIIGSIFERFFVYGVYFAVYPWQAIIFEFAIPFGLFFYVARRYGLDPSRAAPWIALTLFLWGFVLALVNTPLLVIAENVVFPPGHPPQTVDFTSSLSTLTGVAGVIQDSAIFVALGFTAIGFGNFTPQGLGPIGKAKRWLNQEPQEDDEEAPQTDGTMNAE